MTRYFISHPGERQVLASTLKAGAAGQRIVLRTSAPVSSFWLDGNGEQIALLDETGALRVGSLVHASEPRQLTGSSLKPKSGSPAWRSIASANGSSRPSKDKDYECGI